MIKYLSALFLILALACSQSAEPQTADAKTGNDNPDGSGNPAQTQDESDQLFESGSDYSGSHILISHTEAQRAKPEVQRTKEEALAKATQLADRLQQEPELFNSLAKDESDGPSGPTGGFLGSWNKGAMVPEFDAAIEKMQVGEITATPVETSFGYHVIRRDPTQLKHYSGTAFFISWKGAPNMPVALEREKEEAKIMAEQIAEQITAENFKSLADAHNDLAEGPAPLGVFHRATPRLPPVIIDEVDKLQYGQVSGLVELPFAYAFIKRLKVRKLAGSHILIAFSGAERAAASVTRSKEEAAALAAKLLEEIQATPDRFEELAREHSDGPTGPKGGDLGSWFAGNMVAEFDEALDQLTVGEITTAPVETKFGFHIIKRNEVK